MSWTDFLKSEGGSNLIGAGLNFVGGVMQNDSANDANQAAAQASAFKPVGVTTRFGRSGYTYDGSGNMTGAGYQVAPDLAAQREGLMGLAGGSLAQAQEWASTQPWFNDKAAQLGQLGSQYLATSPEQAAQGWMTQQQGLLAPGREQTLARTRNDLQQSGRAGLAFGATQSGNQAATNPEMAAYYNSIANQDAQLASQADAYGRERTKFGVGMLGAGVNTAQQGFDLQGAALKPWQGYLDAAVKTEGLGQGSLDIASALGAKTSTAGANQAQYISRTGTNPLGTTLMGLSNNQKFTSGMGNWLGGMWNTAYTTQPGFTNTPNYLVT